MTELLFPDDASADYMVNSQARRDRALVEDLLRRVDSEQAETKPAKAAEAPAKDAAETGGIGAKIKAVGKDIGGGLVESVTQFAGGVSDLVHNTATAGDALANWLNENVADLTMPGTGIEIIDRPLTAIAGKKGEVPPAKTTTGGFIREATRFLVGFKGAKRLVGGGFAGIPAGAITDFLGQDPDAKRLADVWKGAGLPDNVLADYLASDPTDSEAEKRFKQALEGAALGTLTEGIMLGGRYIRAKWQARSAAQKAGLEQLDALAAAPKVSDRDFILLGDPNEPLVKVSKAVEPEALASARRAGKLAEGMKATETGVPSDVAAKGIVGAAREAGERTGKEVIGEPAVMVNFARIDTGDDVKQVISDMAEAFAPKIAKARRGTITNEVTKELADKLGLTVPDLLQRRQGQPFNAETALAARQLWASSADKLLEAAQKAAAPNAGTVDQFNFRKMMAVHYAVQAEVIGARTETARALQSWRIPAGGGAEKAQAIQHLIDGMGGPQVTQAMAQRLALLAQLGTDDAAIAQFSRKGALATTMDAVREAYVAGLLWLPPTHIANIMGNTFALVGNFVERATAAKIGQTLGRLPGDGVAPGEAAAMYVALSQGIKDTIRSRQLRFWHSITGERLGAAPTSAPIIPPFSKIDLPAGRYSGGAQHAFSARAFNVGEGGTLGRVVDFVGAGARLPFTMLDSEDMAFKSIGYRMAVASHAWRTAYGEGLTGAELGKRAASIFADPPDAIRIAAVDEALYRTFSDKPGAIAEAVLRARNWDHPLNPMILIATFVRTPARLFNYAVERSPLALLQQHTWEAIREGGARGDLALAQIATGSAIFFAATDMAMNGLISGPLPRDPAEREAWQRQGKTAFSFRIGDKWWPINRFDPVTTPISWAATFAEAMQRGEMDPDDVDEWQEVAANMIWGISQSLLSKNYLAGTAQFFEMMEGEPAEVAAFINKTAGSLAAPSFLAGIERAIDPAIREVNDPMDAILARLPGLSERLTPSRDLWGQIKMPDTGVEGFWGRALEVASPSVPRQVKDISIDAELTRLGAYPARIHKKTSFQGVDVNFRDWPQVYDAYVKLAGNELKHPAWGMGAKDFLNAVVEGRHPMSQVYKLQSDGKDGGKAEFIRDTIREYREFAQARILNMPEFAAFREHVKGREREKMERKLPSGIKLPG